ncbi:MAG: acyltransferase [Gordonia sp. (in: high G+C Gram-positive bacteria)]|uniref:acyltransferase family protein n=1 Tax=Gordonia sp. (in: high G+C Gram-positive bacteria) TaxID=84139 RepID=UPI0039E3F5AB
MSTTRSAPLTGLRTIAALAVCLTHAAYWTGGYTDDVTGRLLSRFEVGVALFFVLSGFLLFRPWVRALRDQDRRGRDLEDGDPEGGGRPSYPRLGRYFRHRFRRVVPPYWIVVVAVYLIYLVRTDPGTTGHGWSGLLRNLTFTQVYGFGHLHTGLTQMWSMTAEVAFYLVLPALAWLLTTAVCGDRWRPGPMLASLGLLALLSLFFSIVVHEFPDVDPTARMWPPAFGLWFVGGMALAVVAAMRPRRSVPWAVPLGLVAFVVSAGAFAGEPTIIPAGAVETIVKHVLYLVVALGLIAPLVLTPERPGTTDTLWRRFCGARPMVWFGEISYEFFLVHVMVLEFAMGWLGYSDFSGSTVLVFLVTTVVSTPIAWLLHVVTADRRTRARVFGRPDRSADVGKAAGEGRRRRIS